MGRVRHVSITWFTQAADDSKAQQRSLAVSPVVTSRQVGHGRRHVDDIERGGLQAFLNSSFSLAPQTHNRLSLSTPIVPQRPLLGRSEYSRARCAHLVESAFGGQPRARASCNAKKACRGATLCHTEKQL